MDKASKQTPKPLIILYGGDGVFSGSAEQLVFFKNVVEKFVKKTNIAFFYGTRESRKKWCQWIIG
ncbi:hypothetical protein JDW19_05770 [Paenibacillus polymyxa]|uniref:Uncharacterized protein n=1 Tax=Paenibacillus polymyxa TaxID=1406 RepID=A0A8I1LQ16_PAEPO|nr:hypothetical protein [Paenibacillus polymyxa]